MLTGRCPASRKPGFTSVPAPGPQRLADAPAGLSGLLRPAIGHSQYSLEQIRDMAPSLRFEGATHREPGLASGPPRATSGSPLLPGRSAASGEPSRRAMFA